MTDRTWTSSGWPLDAPPLRPAACPECRGLRLIEDRPPFDPLRFHHTDTCLVRAAEDQTAARDHLALLPGFAASRPVTATELRLLTALDYRDSQGNPPTTATTTHVYRPTAGVRARRWPDLKEPTE